MVTNDDWIRQKALMEDMILPFKEGQISKGISFGVSSYGYDARLAPVFLVLRPGRHEVLDPKNYPMDAFDEVETDVLDLAPYSFTLARTVEYFRIPRDVLCVCMGKSTYARCGLLVNTTPLEPEWQGHITLELTNTTPLPIRLYADEGICQVIFLKAEKVCRTSYADRKGKYQNQTGIVGARA